MKKNFVIFFFNREKNKLNNYEKVKYLKIFYNLFLLNKLKNRDFFNKKIFYFLKNKNFNFIIMFLYNFIFKIGFKKSNYLLLNSLYDIKNKFNKIKKIIKVYIYIV